MAVYWLAGIVVFLYFLLWLAAFLDRRGKGPPDGREAISASGKRKGGIFDLQANYLYGLLVRYKVALPGKRQVEQDLQRLHPGFDTVPLQEAYYCTKIRKLLWIILAGSLIGAACSYQASHGGMLSEDGTVTRGGFQEMPGEIALETVLEDGERQQFVVEVEPLILTKEEQQRVLEEFREALPDLIAEDNADLTSVTSDLYLADYYEGYPFGVEWRSDRPDVISSLGTVYEVEKAESVKLTAIIGYEDSSWTYDMSLMVVPVVLSEEEQRYEELSVLLRDSQQNSRNLQEWKLPDDWNGQMLIWKESREDYGVIIAVAGVLLGGVLFFMEDKDLHDTLLQKSNCMKRAYPELIHAVVLYLGAGLTMRGVLHKLAEDYEGAEEGTGRQQIARELQLSRRQLLSGMSESEAYEQLGRRSGVQEYIRFGTLLTQNLQKGNRELLKRLQDEADKAFREQLQNSRRLGEEAATKLLVPMVLFLLVVMVMIMLPAFSSMG